ncbi:MAG: hypothetical protein AAFP83_20970 [Bacteroidota bacterium]
MVFLALILSFLPTVFLAFAIVVPISLYLRTRGDEQMVETSQQVIDFLTRAVRWVGTFFLLPAVLIFSLYLFGYLSEDSEIIRAWREYNWLYHSRGIAAGSTMAGFIIFVKVANISFPAIFSQLFYFIRFRESSSFLKFYAGMILTFGLLNRFLVNIVREFACFCSSKWMPLGQEIAEGVFFIQDALFIAGCSILVGLMILFWVQKIRFSGRRK